MTFQGMGPGDDILDSRTEVYSDNHEVRSRHIRVSQNSDSLDIVEVARENLLHGHPTNLMISMKVYRE